MIYRKAKNPRSFDR